MKKSINPGLVALCLSFLVLYGCEKPELIGQRNILLSNSYPVIFDTLTFTAKYYTELDGEQVFPRYYDWVVSESTGKIVKDDFDNARNMIWIPQNPGLFNISVELVYLGKKFKLNKELYISDSTEFLQELTVTQPEIKINNDSSGLFVDDQLVISVKEYAHFHNRRVIPQKYDWSISDSIGNIVKNDFESVDSILWTPEEAGKYLVEVKLNYGGNVTSSGSKDFEAIFDFRRPYCGNYHFLWDRELWWLGEYSRDTIYTDGYVNFDSGNDLNIIIKYDPKPDEILNTELFPDPDSLNASFVAILTDNYKVYGHFVNYDSLIIYREALPHAGASHIKIYGSKLK